MAVVFLSGKFFVGTNKIKTNPVHPVIFFDERSFSTSVNKAKNNQPLSYHAVGGIVPHDLFASFVISDFFSRIKAQKPITIILLGPNHHERGNFKVLTSLYDWETPFGLLHPDTVVIDDLINNNLVLTDEKTLPDDQAISAILPFIKFYLPESKIVPLLLSGTMTQNVSEILANKLSSLVTKDVIIVASVDFSHYLNSNQAKTKDKETLKVMNEFDFRKLFLFGNDYLDSPPSIAVLLMVMQKMGTTKSDLLFHSNSGELQFDNIIQTTSYFEMVYH